MAVFFSLSNLRSTIAAPMQAPWEEWSQFPLPTALQERTDKKAYEKWLSAPDTKHALISAVEGRDAALRVTQNRKKNAESNPAALIHGVIADYDTPISDEKAREFLLAGDHGPLPQYLVESFTPGKRRLVWEFQTPMRVSNPSLAASAFKVLQSRLNLPDRLPGFDAKAHSATQYFAIGQNWTPVLQEPLPTGTLFSWFEDAAHGVKEYRDQSDDRPAIPIETIAAEVESRFPGRWDGAFDLGTRGIRFWDPGADSQRAAIVTEHGMLCFTGSDSFVSWETIFGKAFVESTRGEWFGALRENFFYDGQRFWRRDEASGIWVSESKDDARRIWHCHGLSRQRTKGQPSEIDRFETEICRDNRVMAALPFLYREPGPLYWESRRYLNTSDVKVLAPSLPFGHVDLDFDVFGTKHFPWLHAFFRQLFAPPGLRESGIPEGVDLRDVALMIFLGWLQRTYRGGYTRNPTQGQALVLAGPVGVGKSFLVEGILARLLGPVADGSAYLVEGAQWTDTACESALMVVDDTLAASQHSMQKRYTALIKKAVANMTMTYNKKYGSYGRVLWTGRVIVCCNTDPESLRILPDLEQSTLDKISMFLVQAGIELPGYDFQQKKIREELPQLARWLLDWEPPEWVLAPVRYRGRFGVRSYHHTVLREAASATGTANTVLEVLRDLYEEWRERREDTDLTLPGTSPLQISEDEKEIVMWEWRGRTSRLYRELNRYAGSIMNRMTSHQLSLALGVLSARGFKVYTDTGGRWRIVFDESLLTAFDPTKNMEQ